MKLKHRLAGLLCAALLLAACGNPASNTPEESSATVAPAETTEAAVGPAEPPADEETAAPEATPDPANVPQLGEDAVTMESGLEYEDTVVGEGEVVEAGDLVTVDYSGYLEDGTKFDSSTDRGEPYTFPVGYQQGVIPGLEEGIQGMKVGGKRTLVIPSELAYGPAGMGEQIPPDATLIFEVEVLEVEKMPQPTEVEEYTETESGLEYAVLQEGEGETAQEGQLVTIHYNGWIEDGLLFNSSVQVGQPAEFMLGSSGIAGLDEGIEGMKVGEKRQLRIPPELAFGEEGAGAVIPPDATLLFEVELIEVKEMPTPTSIDEGEYETTDSGLQYAILTEGEGEEAKSGDTVAVHYTGWLEDGMMFDSSADRAPFQFTLDAGQVIPGWDEGVQGMKVGEKRQLRIPAELGYGEMGAGPIPPNATLIFEVELLEIVEAEE